MKIIALDTSFEYLCLAFFDGEKDYLFSIQGGRKNSILLIPAIRRCLASLGWKPQDIDYISVGIGPGSFTGIRVGLSTAKGLAWSLHKPLVGIPSLDLIAFNASLALKDKPQLLYSSKIIVAVDAKRDQCYFASYRFRQGHLRRISSYQLLSLADFIRIIPDSAILLGDALGLCAENLKRKKQQLFILDKDFWRPCCLGLIALSRERIAEKKTESVFKLNPLYLYPQDCQVKKQRNRSNG